MPNLRKEGIKVTNKTCPMANAPRKLKADDVLRRDWLTSDEGIDVLGVDKAPVLVSPRVPLR